MIEFEEVTKVFGTGQKALDAVDFSVEPGEFAFVVGPSGAGKTTLLRLIIRDLMPTEGKILINEQELNRLKSKHIPQLRRQIGMVFQDFRLLKENTVFENVALPLIISGERGAQVRGKVMQALELVGLADKASHFPVQCSAGELQRISLARAMVAEPKLILADEPTGNLDPRTSWELMELLNKVHEHGHTVLITTHDQDIVNSFKRRVIKLKEGKVIEDIDVGSYS